jgi:hypothetical protein
MKGKMHYFTIKLETVAIPVAESSYLLENEKELH